MPHHYSLWQKRLRERLFEQPYPLWVDSQGVLPAASLWYQMRERLLLLRDAEIGAGDRIVLQLPVHRDFLAWMFAGFWQGCTVVLAPPTSDAQALATFFSAKAVINENGLRNYDSGESIPTPDICLLVASSGTSGMPRWIALSDRNIFSVLDSHTPILNLVDVHESSYSAARVLSLLPLHHAFGLVIDFFAAFFAGAEIVRDNSGGRDVQQILRLADNHSITHCSFVPLLVKRLAAVAEGRIFLRSLQGGVIGGAPVNGELAAFLRTTRLRVGYGQTEASPGITLGEPGVWREHYLGQAIGCKTRMSTEGVLEFYGENAHTGLWTEQGLIRYAADRWVSTGDYVKVSTDTTAKGYIFVGRADDTFKLANGRFIPAPEWEMILRSRLEGCTEVMIFSHDSERCTVYIAFSSEVPMQTIEQLRESVLEYLPIPNDLLDEVCIIPLDKWLYTPKGSTNRSAMREMTIRQQQ